MSKYQKHLIECRCTLPQYKKLAKSPNHMFVVFSEIDDNNNVKLNFAQCNNCGIIHKVTEIGRSDIVPGKENMSSIITIDDIKISLPESLVSLLDANYVDIATWQAASFLYENKKWGEFVTLTSDVNDGIKQGKYVRILGENLFKIETYTREEGTLK